MDNCRRQLVAKLRRFAMSSLEGVAVGAEMYLSPQESRHVRVLRLEAGAEIELFDRRGLSALAVIKADSPQGVQVCLLAIPQQRAPKQQAVKLVLATAWPKGKRAAVL